MTRLYFDFSRKADRRWFVLLSVLLILISGAAFLGNSLAVQSVEQHWDTIRTEEEQSLSTYVQASFSSYQNEANELAYRIAQDSNITTSLQAGTALQQELFDHTASLSENDYTIEIFDSSKMLKGWSGNEGVKTDTRWLQQKLRSFIIQGPIYSFLIIVQPVFGDGGTLSGYVVVKRIFDVRYPINNRFINDNVFTSTFSSRFGLEGKFDFSLQEPKTIGNDVIAIHLPDVEGNRLGSALVHRMTLEERTSSLALFFNNLLRCSLLCFLILLLVGGYSLSFTRDNLLRKAFWASLSIWVFRYALVFMDIPESFFRIDLFEPTLFASTFGYGIAKSIGDMFISSLCLFLTVIVIGASIAQYRRAGAISLEPETIQLSQRSSSPAWTIFFAAIVGLFLPILLRGFAAVIHSAVFDSTLRYNDRMSIVPPFHPGVMLLSIYLLALALVVTGVLCIIALQRKLHHSFGFKRHSRIPFYLSLGILITGSVLIGIIHPSPLFSQADRLVYILLFASGSLLIGEGVVQRKELFTMRTMIVISIAGIFATVYPLDRKVHEYDRSQVEFLASTIFRPADSYLTILTQQALRELSTTELTEDMNEQQPEILKKLAFKAWAQSVLSREGYNCSVTYFNSQGVPVSSFYLGTDLSPLTIQRDSLEVPRQVQLEERVSKSRLVRIYKGYAPIFNNAGEFLGGVGVEVSAGKQALLEGETPEFLRNYPEEQLDTRHRTLTYSEYNEGKLTFSSSPAFYSGIILPASLSEKTGEEGIWLEQTIDNLGYETFFFHPEGSNGSTTWYALSMRKLDLSSHIYHVLRIALFLLVFFFLVTSGIVFIVYLRGTRIGFSFRLKLMGAFFIVALIPMAILAYYNRQYAVERVEESVVEQLKRETSTLASALQRQWGLLTPFDLRGFTDQDAAYAANDVNIPFTLFSGAYEMASSTPELFRAELFDRRMTSDAYLNVVLQKKSFYSNVQSIGTLQYIVGYRPLVSESGDVFAVIAAPTLFRLREIDRELLRRNSYLFGAFVFAMIVALVIGTIFSQQISSPVRRLHQATKKIGAGDFDVQLRRDRTDELGELERSFDTMLAELKQTQAEMMKAQRELAWKEMAKQVAHEIKNPLTPIKLSVQHLRQAYIDRVADFDKLLHQVTNTILEQIETLSRIASEFSHFARMPARNISECDIHQTLREVTDLFSQYRNVIFDLQFSKNSPIISADKEELRRAFVNILRNSIQAMNDKGTITIQTQQENNNALITITDTGAGIPLEVQPHLFEPNFSTKTDGMGLGLAIVKKTIDDLGGSISITSEQGKGASVSLTLPLVRTN